MEISGLKTGFLFVLCLRMIKTNWISAWVLKVKDLWPWPHPLPGCCPGQCFVEVGKFCLWPVACIGSSDSGRSWSAFLGSGPLTLTSWLFLRVLQSILPQESALIYWKELFGLLWSISTHWLCLRQQMKAVSGMRVCNKSCISGVREFLRLAPAPEMLRWAHPKHKV
jgi:hypothetical protein